MKIFLRIFSVLTIALGSTNAFAQTCTVDYSLTAPGIYPDTLPSGYVGQPYSEDIQFVLPTDTMGYTFLNFHIVSISLPIGLNWQCSNQANGCNYDPAVSVHGCVNVYGTPCLWYTSACRTVSDYRYCNCRSEYCKRISGIV